MAIFKLGKQFLLTDPRNALFSLLDTFMGRYSSLSVSLSLSLFLSPLSPSQKKERKEREGETERRKKGRKQAKMVFVPE